jgi:6-hydroxymethylpterin diphosphokinase MptE-like protein
VAGLGERLASRIGEVTLAKTAQLGLENARKNLPYVRKTIADLGGTGAAPDAAVVVCAGPSLHRNRPLSLLRDARFRGTVIAVDGSLGHCLQNGVVPDFVVTVDPHPYRIVRWFGDPDFAARPADDYFRRQDLDPSHWEDEERRNRELMDAVDRHGPAIKCLIATCVDPTVTARCLAAGMELYWWNPLYDDHDAPDSVSRRAFELNGVPCMVTGGNCGSAAWVAAHSVLETRTVALLGFDLGYPPGTPLQRTQYYAEMAEIFGDRIADFYIEVANPQTGETWYADPTYYWYRSVFLQMVSDAPCQTFNCSEGGTVFGDGVTLTRFEEFLRLHAGAA